MPPKDWSFATAIQYPLHWATSSCAWRVPSTSMLPLSFYTPFIILRSCSTTRCCWVRLLCVVGCVVGCVLLLFYSLFTCLCSSFLNFNHRHNAHPIGHLFRQQITTRQFHVFRGSFKSKHGVVATLLCDAKRTFLCIVGCTTPSFHCT